MKNIQNLQVLHFVFSWSKVPAKESLDLSLAKKNGGKIRASITGTSSRCRLKMKVQPIYQYNFGRGQYIEKKFFIEIVGKQSPKARKSGKAGAQKKKKLKMSCKRKNKKNGGKKPDGIKVSDIADYFFSNTEDTGKLPKYLFQMKTT